MIEDAGYGDRFTHGLGHGVGLEIHEGPCLAPERRRRSCPPARSSRSSRAIYVPALGGVRIEDTVEVTDDGCRVLGVSTRELIEL